jgi:DNA polymerase III sliding clamp (beta) subunit (PCNA family)
MCVPHAALSDLIAGLTKGTSARKLATTTATLAPHPSRPVLSLLGYQVPIEALPAEDFPELPDPDQATARVEGPAFTEALARVMTAHDPGAEPEILTSVSLESTDGELHITTVNRYRLATARLPICGHAPEFRALVSGAFLGKLGKLLSGETVTLEVEDDEGGGFVRIRSGHITALLRLVDGDYVKWQYFLPQAWVDGPATTLAADRAALVDLTDKAAVITRATGGRALPVTVTADHAGITIGPDDDTVTPRVAAELNGASASYRIRVAPAYLRAALTSVPGGRALLQAQAPDRPVVFTSADDDPIHFHHVVMPIRL